MVSENLLDETRVDGCLLDAEDAAFGHDRSESVVGRCEQRDVVLRGEEGGRVGDLAEQAEEGGEVLLGLDRGCEIGSLSEYRGERGGCEEEGVATHCRGVRSGGGGGDGIGEVGWSLLILFVVLDGLKATSWVSLHLIYTHMLKGGLPEIRLRRRNAAVREMSHCLLQTTYQGGMAVDSQTFEHRLVSESRRARCHAQNVR